MLSNKKRAGMSVIQTSQVSHVDIEFESRKIICGAPPEPFQSPDSFRH